MCVPSARRLELSESTKASTEATVASALLALDGGGLLQQNGLHDGDATTSVLASSESSESPESSESRSSESSQARSAMVAAAATEAAAAQQTQSTLTTQTTGDAHLDRRGDHDGENVEAAAATLHAGGGEVRLVQDLCIVRHRSELLLLDVEQTSILVHQHMLRLATAQTIL